MPKAARLTTVRDDTGSCIMRQPVCAGCLELAVSGSRGSCCPVLLHYPRVASHAHAESFGSLQHAWFRAGGQRSLGSGHSNLRRAGARRVSGGECVQSPGQGTAAAIVLATARTGTGRGGQRSESAGLRASVAVPHRRDGPRVAFRNRSAEQVSHSANSARGSALTSCCF